VNAESKVPAEETPVVRTVAPLKVTVAVEPAVKPLALMLTRLPTYAGVGLRLKVG